MFILVAIKDKKAETFSQIYQFKNKAVAIRELSVIVNQKDSQLNQFADDYTLMLIGAYDENNGTILGRPKPEFIIEAKDLKIKEK